MEAIGVEGADLKAIQLFSALSDSDRERVATVARAKRWNRSVAVISVASWTAFPRSGNAVRAAAAERSLAEEP
jgi:hypothetical protein